jgi:hypothetical protein
VNVDRLLATSGTPSDPVQNGLNGGQMVGCGRVKDDITGSNLPQNDGLVVQGVNA